LPLLLETADRAIANKRHVERRSHPSLAQVEISRTQGRAQTKVCAGQTNVARGSTSVEWIGCSP
jgi:hypothetical protein